MHRFPILCLAFAFPMQCALSAAEENWPQWRGPLGTGVAPAGDYPVKFSNKDGVAWKAKLPGVGTSTPAVWGDRIFVTCGIKSEGGETKDGVLCAVDEQAFFQEGFDDWTDRDVQFDADHRPDDTDLLDERRFLLEFGEELLEGVADSSG